VPREKPSDGFKTDDRRMTRIIKAITNRLPFARLLTSTPKTEHKIEEKNPTDIDKITNQENSWAPIAKSK
jgi:hypothetical protein